MKYDLIVVSFSEPSTDARTLNFIRTSVDLGYSTALIALQDNQKPDKIKGVDLYYIPKNNAHRMYKRWYSFIRKAGKLIKELESDRVVAADLYSLPVISKAFAKKYIYDSREVYSAMGPIAGHRIKQKIIKEIEKYYSKILNVIYTSGDLDSEYLKNNLTDKPEYFEIYNVPPYKEHLKTNIIREKFEIEEDKRIILYQGALLPYRGLIPMINYLRKSDRDVLCVIGYGEYERTIKELSMEDDLIDKIFIVGKIPYDDLHIWTSSADFGMALFEPVSFSYELSFPNKLFEYIMARKPVLATDLPAIRIVYERFQFGALIDREMKIKDIEKGIDYILENYHSIQNDLKEAALEYCYENQKEKIKSILKL